MSENCCSEFNVFQFTVSYAFFLFVCSALTFPQVGQPVLDRWLHDVVVVRIAAQKSAIIVFLVVVILFTFELYRKFISFIASTHYAFTFINNLTMISLAKTAH